MQGRSPFDPRSPFGSSISGMSLASLASSAETLTAARPASGVAYLSGVNSPRSSSSVASDVFEGHMEVSGGVAPSGACQAMPRPCISSHLSVNVRSTPFQKPCKALHSC